MSDTLRLMAFLSMLIVFTNVSVFGEENQDSAALFGTIRCTGEVPDPVQMRANGVIKKNGKRVVVKTLPDESLMVNSKNCGVANVIVYLDKKPAGVERDLERMRLSVQNLRFEPRVQCLQVGQEVLFSNPSEVPVNLNLNTLRNKPLNKLLDPDGKGKFVHTYERIERRPIKIVSDFQPWMVAWHLVIDHSFAAVTNEKGQFIIKGLPHGEHKIRIWHERSGFLEDAFEVTIQPEQGASIELSYPVENFGVK